MRSTTLVPRMRGSTPSRHPESLTLMTFVVSLLWLIKDCLRKWTTSPAV